MRHRLFFAATAIVFAGAMLLPESLNSSILHAAGPTTAPAADDTLVALLPDSGGFYNLQFRATVDGQPLAIPCRVFLPRGYEKSKDSLPLLVFLHGEDERGTDLAALINVGPEKRLREDQGFRDNTRFIIVSPQCSPKRNWDDPAMAQAVVGLIDQVTKRFRVDADRVSLTGTGMGAVGAWRMAAADPDRFAAVATTSAKAGIADGLAPKIRHLFAYVVAPQNEKVAYDAYLQTSESLGRAHLEVQVRLAGNNVRETTQWFYSDNGNYDWLSQKKRRTPREKKEREDRDTKELNDYIASLPKAPGTYKLKYITWAGDKKQAPFHARPPSWGRGF